MKKLARDQVEALRQFDTPTVANAIEGFQVRARTAGYIGGRIRCQFPELGVRVGYAVTAVADSTTPCEKPDLEREWSIWQALEQAPKPAFLVLQDGGKQPDRACFFGEMMGNMAFHLGASGMLTDGNVRDVVQLRSLGLQVYAAGFVASHGSFHIRHVNIPVQIDGVDIEPGTLLHADANGLITVPIEIVPSLLGACKAFLDREAAMLEYIRGPGFSAKGLRRWYGLEEA